MSEICDKKEPNTACPMVEFEDSTVFSIYECKRCGLIVKYSSNEATYLKPNNEVIVRTLKANK